PGHIPAIGRVEVQLKRGRHLNELTRFRYDAVLHIGGEGGPAAEPAARDWQDEALTLGAVGSLLAGSGPAGLRVLRVPNARLGPALRAVELLGASEGPATAHALREALREAGPS